MGCRHHLWADTDRDGKIRATLPGREPWELQESCVLDLADRWPDGLTLEECGTVLGLTRERVRQIENAAVQRANTRLRRLGIVLGDYLRDDTSEPPM